MINRNIVVLTLLSLVLVNPTAGGRIFGRRWQRNHNSTGYTQQSGNQTESSPSETTPMVSPERPRVELKVVREIPINEGYVKKGRWLVLGDQKYYQFEDANGNWQTAQKFEIANKKDDTFLDKDGNTVHYAKGDIVFTAAGDLGKFKAPATEETVTKAIDNEEEVIASRISANRPHLRRSPELDAAARERARVSAFDRLFSHFDRNRLGPNYYARKNGFPLPGWMGDHGNQIESIAWGTSSGDDSWNIWMGSPGHRGHILGQTLGQDHTDFGVGHFYSPETGDVWTVMTAPRTN
ncbi:MAG: CAP domain-containing protein [Deltaproteobacteria bacterium]|nr:CAP domain-containing protein [Deltaproteobacteria bacterium]